MNIQERTQKQIDRFANDWYGCGCACCDDQEVEVMIGDILEWGKAREHCDEVAINHLLSIWHEFDFSKSLNEIFSGEVKEEQCNHHRIRGEDGNRDCVCEELFKNPNAMALLEFLESIS